MIEYVTIRKNAENIDKIKNNTYGICAYRVDDGLIEILNCVYEISDNIVWVKALADKLNQYDVDPVHLNDIIEDELYNIRDKCSKRNLERNLNFYASSNL